MKRYDLSVIGVVENPIGGWVTFTEADAQITALKARIEELEEACEDRGRLLMVVNKDIQNGSYVPPVHVLWGINRVAEKAAEALKSQEES